MRLQGATLTEPCVNLSIHTAPASHPLETSRSQADAERTRLLPVAWLTIACRELAHPLRFFANQFRGEHISQLLHYSIFSQLY